MFNHYRNIRNKYQRKLSSNNKSWKLSNLYAPKYTKDIKFTELADLAPIHFKDQLEDEKSNECIVVPSGICDPIKNSQSYKELISTLNISTYDNNDAFIMIKGRLKSENIEHQLNSNLLEEIENLNNERRVCHNSNSKQETDIIFLWRSTKLSIKPIAIKLDKSICLVKNILSKYRKIIRKALLTNRINSNKERKVICQDQISQIKNFCKINRNKPFYVSDVAREVWPKSDGRIPPESSTISRVLKKTLRMSYRRLKQPQRKY